MENVSHYIVEKAFQKRQILAIYAFFGYFMAYSMRAILSVAIIDMTQPSPPDGNRSNHSTNLTTNLTDVNQFVTNIASLKSWSPVLQGYILSSFFYGYILTQIPSGYLTSRFGGKIFFGAGNGICAVFCLLTPAFVLLGPYSLICVRIIQGMAQGLIFPAMHCLWSKWAPPNERSRLSTFGLSGSYIGSVISLALGGVIGEYLNWQAIFYVFGSVSIIWTILWFVFTAETPCSHPCISNEERNMIETSLPNQDEEKSATPWTSILRSGPFWAIAAAHFAENWGFYTMLTKMPTFFSDVLNFKIDEVGMTSSLPYLVMALFLYLSGFISDKLIENRMTCLFVRRLFCCMGFIIQAIFMILIVNTTVQFSLITFMTLAIGLGGMVWASFAVNLLDIGAKYANILMSLSNTIATLPGIFSPILTGYLTRDRTKLEWNVVFYISAAIYVIGALVFGFLSSGSTQKWAIKSVDDKNVDKEKKHAKETTPISSSHLSNAAAYASVVVQENTAYVTTESTITS